MKNKLLPVRLGQQFSPPTHRAALSQVPTDGEGWKLSHFDRSFFCHNEMPTKIQGTEPTCLRHLTGFTRLSTWALHPKATSLKYSLIVFNIPFDSAPPLPCPQFTITLCRLAAVYLNSLLSGILSTNKSFSLHNIYCIYIYIYIVLPCHVRYC